MDRYEKILYAYVVFKPMILSMKYYTVNLCYVWSGFFFKENVRYPVWVCRDPISLILGTR